MFALEKYKIIAKVILFFFVLSTVNSSLTFELHSEHPKCFFEELFNSSVMMVKWKITGLPETEEAKNTILSHINVQIFADGSSDALQNTNVRTFKDKISFTPPAAGYYRICVSYTPSWGHRNHAKIMMGVKINSDNMDEPNLEAAIKKEDVDTVGKKIKEFVELGKPILQGQEMELQTENSNANMIISSGRKYYYMAVVQIVVVLFVGIYQIINFRQFIKSKF